jgi:hypothetical protein
MAFTFSKLAEVTVGSGGASTIDFINIPQNYTDLVVKASFRDSTNDTDSNFWIRFNDNLVGYSRQYFYGGGSAHGAIALSGTNEDRLYAAYSNSATSTGSTFGNTEFYIPNYTSPASKSVSFESVAEGNIGGMRMAMVAGLWASTVAINKISIFPWVSPFVQHSTATLYGVKAEV